MKRLVLEWLMLLYPRRWRERYGPELRALLEEQFQRNDITTLGAGAGLVVAAAREHVRASARPRYVVVVAICAGVALVVLVSTKGPDTRRQSALPPPETALTLPARTPLSRPLVKGATRLERVCLRTCGAVGYEPTKDLVAGRSGPVYASDRMTLVGYERPGQGFVALGAAGPSRACSPQKRTVVLASHQVVHENIACRAHLKMPDLVGLRAPTALGRLSALGLPIITVGTISSSVAPGRVVSTSPTSGAELVSGQEITVRLSSRP